MKVLLALVAALSMVDLGTPCCFPDQLFFGYSVAMNSTNLVTGKAAVDFKRQKLTATIDHSKQIIHVDLSKQPGSIQIVMFPRNETAPDAALICQQIEISGTAGKEWQCLLDNTKYFAEQDGGKSYQLTIPKILDGPVTMMKDQCIPLSADVSVVSPPQNPPVAPTTNYVTVEITDALTKIPDMRALQPPCPKGAKLVEQHQLTPLKVLTPDQLFGMIQIAYGLGPNAPTTPEPESSSESSEQQDSSSSSSSSASSSSDDDDDDDDSGRRR